MTAVTSALYFRNLKLLEHIPAPADQLRAAPTHT